MTCYLRHMNWLFEALDLEYVAENRARVDAALRAIFGLPVEAGCPVLWATIKELTDDERNALVPAVAAQMAG